MSEQRIPFRAPLHEGISEELVETLVRTFYDKVRADEQIGPIFESVIGEDWEPHLQKMFAFWSSLTMLTGRYKGQPMAAHLKLKNVKPEHFDVWLSLFSKTANDVCGSEIAPVFIEKAGRVAESFKLGMFFDPKASDNIQPSDGMASS
jgi:hemoglobin